MLHVPAAVATVFPGQFPVCWCKPVSALKSELFPTFGFPHQRKTVSFRHYVFASCGRRTNTEALSPARSAITVPQIS